MLHHLTDVGAIVLIQILKSRYIFHSIFFSRDYLILGKLLIAVNDVSGERVIVLTHGGVLRELHKHAVSGRSSDGRIHNTSVNVFLISESGNWTIKTWGDISHLHEIGVLNNAFGGDRTSG